jgi:hypothetical protein
MSPQSRLVAGIVLIIVPTVEIGRASYPACYQQPDRSALPACRGKEYRHCSRS